MVTIRVSSKFERQYKKLLNDIKYAARIKFIFLAKSEVLFLEIGTHDIYR